jgi:hypothetical protein
MPSQVGSLDLVEFVNEKVAESSAGAAAHTGVGVPDRRRLSVPGGGRKFRKTVNRNIIQRRMGLILAKNFLAARREYWLRRGRRIGSAQGLRQTASPHVSGYDSGALAY